MSLTVREFWTAAHGMVFGAVFLLSFAGGLAELFAMRPDWVTAAGLKARLARLKVGTILMAVASWLTVITGSYIVYPWYRAAPPEGADLTFFPRSFLKADPNLSGWHVFGMEWKEHVAWFSPILATLVVYLVVKYGPELLENAKLRRIVMIIFVLSFSIAGIAGLLGALITKAAPII